MEHVLEEVFGVTAKDKDLTFALCFSEDLRLFSFVLEETCNNETN